MNGPLTDAENALVDDAFDHELDPGCSDEGCPKSLRAVVNGIIAARQAPTVAENVQLRTILNSHLGCGHEHPTVYPKCAEALREAADQMDADWDEWGAARLREMAARIEGEA